MIEQMLLGLLILGAAGWVISKSPILTWIFVFLFMLLVSLFAIGCAAFVAIAIHIPKQNYWAAGVSIALGIFCSGLVVLPTWEYFVRHIKDLKQSLSLWE